jgi:hypothetical protein
MRLVAEYAHKVAVMLDGSVRFSGRPSELFRQSELLASAHLNLPPLARLTALLGTRYPQLEGFSTLTDYRNISRPETDEMKV